MRYFSLLKFETLKNFKTSLYFTITWIALSFLFMGFFEPIRQNSDQLTQLYASFPKELLEVFGKGIESLTSIYGYFGNQIMIYIVLSGCIFFIFMSANSLSGEIGNRNILFLLSKPLSRLQIYSAKLFAVLINVLISNLILLASTLLAINFLTKETNLDLGFFILVFVALTILEFFFIGLSELIGSKFASGRAIALGSLYVIVGYLFNTLSGLSDQASFLKYLSPNHYLDLVAISTDRVLKPEALLILIVGIFFTVIGAYIFKKRDIN